MKDEIIEELWQIKDELARRTHYNIGALCRELREKQLSSRAPVVDRSVVRPATTIHTPQP